MGELRRVIRSLGAAAMLTIALGGCRSTSEGPADPPDEGGSTGGDTDGPHSSGGAAPLDGPDTCVETHAFFHERVHGPILQSVCYGCHNATSVAGNSRLVLEGYENPDYLQLNYEMFAELARVEQDGTPLVLSKPVASLEEHGGGVVLDPDGEPFERMVEMVDRLTAPHHCPPDDDPDAFFEGLVLADEVATLRKAALLLAGRLPTPEEIDAVDGAGIDALDPVLRAMMDEDAFYARMRAMYHERLQTDVLVQDEAALVGLDPTRYPGADAFTTNDLEARAWANEAVAREPLMIIDNVLRKHVPFTEILTGDYTMVNPYSAQAYGLDVEALGFEDPNDPDEYVEYDFAGVPQAGVLTTTAFLARYPDTDTNRARARARFLYLFFAGEDVQKLGARPIQSLDLQSTNPTLFDSNCTVCHVVIDPAAGAFQNYTFEGWYRPVTAGTWYSDMLPPGWEDETIPPDDVPRSLRWVADRVVADPRFARSVVHTVYAGLTGDEPLRQPFDGAHPDHVAKVNAFKAQKATFDEVASTFIDADYDVRALVIALVKTPWFRAIDVQGELSHRRQIELSSMGAFRILPPELLHDRIVATLGFPWMHDGEPALLSVDNYRFEYGGVDASTVTLRITQPNAVMDAVAGRMSRELACQATAWELGLPVTQRRLFPYVDAVDDIDGAGGEAAIRDNIQHLHEYVLGERLESDDPELERTFQVFAAVLADGRDGLADGDYAAALPVPCRATVDRVTGVATPEGIVDDPDYTIRAWMAVVTYLLGDTEFLFG
jgi:hypothetical protein